MSTSSALVVRGLGRRFGGFPAVRGVDFEVPESELVALLGPNGAGKSTLLRMLAGCLAPTAGAARVAGYDLLREPQQVRARVGWSPEAPPSDPERSAADLVEYVARLRLLPRAAAPKALDRVGLEPLDRRRVSTLSRGQQRRVGLAMALVHEPRVLLLDEPAAGLDPDQRASLRTLLRNVAASGTAVLFSTHFMEEAAAVADRVLVLRDGEITADGPAQDATAVHELYRSESP